MSGAPANIPATGEIAFSQLVKGERRGDVLVVTIDHPPVNAIGQQVRAGLSAAMSAVARDASVAAVVLSGQGKCFIGGADIREFDQAPAEPVLPAVIEQIESSAKPVVAAINGIALGGGLEVALAAHARVALERARLGFPEVNIGVVPGAGGTQRLPRLIRAPAAASMIASGRAESAAAALELGLVDRVVAADVVGASVALARSLAGTPPRRTSALPPPAGDDNAIDAAVARTLQRARGQVAPLEAVRLVKAVGRRPLAEGLADERATFMALKGGEQAAALRHVFFAERAAAKVEGLDGIAPREVRTIGVVGLGLMGTGIAAAALGAGFRVAATDQTGEQATRGAARIAALLDRSLASGRLSQEERDAQLARLSTSANLDDLAGADLVIEAVFDDLDVKIALLQRLENVVGHAAVLATNTSYLNPDHMAAAMKHPGRLVGMHFFSPANVMRLTEIARCASTTSDALATALHVARRMGKLPVVCGVIEGFIGNRVFSAYRQEAEYLVEDGASPYEIDAAMESFGMPMGPFAISDLAGLEIAWARRKRDAANRDPAARYVDIADRLCESGRLGQKTGRGWYLHEDGRRHPDPAVLAMIDAARAARGVTPRPFAQDEIERRMLAAMAQEGRALLDRKIAARASDIDLVMINGYGFPAYRGGPMFLAEGDERSS